VLESPLLADSRYRISFVLSGSRAVGYHVPRSDYDFLGLCDSETYAHIAELSGRSPAASDIDIFLNEEAAKLGDGIKADVSLFDKSRIEGAFQSYRDVVIWIWANARIIVDRDNSVHDLKQSFNGYPRNVLEQKLRYHWLRDFNLSVHSMTYQPKSQNVFSVVYALSSKIAEQCKLCCLLDGKPFPYDKWLLRACGETKLGAKLSPIFHRVTAILTKLENDLEKNWKMVQEATSAIDTEACDILEDALVEWGFEREWIDNSIQDLGDMLFIP
jgi:hypothetical protein